jgi:hypothetical protein
MQHTFALPDEDAYLLIRCNGPVDFNFVGR